MSFVSCKKRDITGSGQRAVGRHGRLEQYLVLVCEYIGSQEKLGQIRIEM